MCRVMSFGRSFRCGTGRERASFTLRSYRSPNSIPFRLRCGVIYAKKGTPLYLTSATGPKEGKKKLLKSKTRYVEEEPGASGTKGKVIPKEEAPPPPPVPTIAEKVENVAVATNVSLPFPINDQVRAAGAVSGGILLLWFITVLFKRIFRPKQSGEPVITIAKMEATIADREQKMQEEFTKILAEELEKRDAEHKAQLLEEIGKREADFDARVTTHEREVRVALDTEFKSQIKKETENIRQQLTKEREAHESDLKEQFEDQKSQIEMEWMKKLEDKEKEREESNQHVTEAQQLVKELKSNQEQLKAHEGTLEAQLKEYETMLKSLKESHKVEIDGALTKYQSEIRGLKEEIRKLIVLVTKFDGRLEGNGHFLIREFQENEIERRKKVKAEEEEKLRAAATVQEAVQENGHLAEQAGQSVALQTRPLPETTEEPQTTIPQTLPVHKNGRVTPEEVFEAEVRMVCAGTTIPHVEKVLRGGEDAFFVNSVGYGAMGVADGVGSWGAESVDPALYPKELMTAASEYLDSKDPQQSLLQLVQHAHETAKSPGSATMCVALVQPDGVLEVANLGDCGVRVIRGSKCVFATETMSHEFNMPYQLANPLVLPETDWPTDAELYSFELKEGDVIVMGSDGLFDNMWDEDLTRIVNSFVGEHPTDEETALEVSKRIADIAHYNAKQKKIRSPWAVQAAAAGVTPLLKRLFPEGGKMDDCTVVVGFANRCN